MYRMHNDSAARFPFASPPVPCFFSPSVCRFVLVPLVVPAGQVALCAFAFAWDRTAAACYAGCARWPQGADRRPSRVRTCSIAVFGGRLSARPVLFWHEYLVARPRRLCRSWSCRGFENTLPLSPWSWAMEARAAQVVSTLFFCSFHDSSSHSLSIMAAHSGMLVRELRRSWADALIQSDVTEPPRACGAGNPETGAGGRSRR